MTNAIPRRAKYTAPPPKATIASAMVAISPAVESISLMSYLRNSWGLPLGASSILLVSTYWPCAAEWMPALEDRRHAERWK